MDVILELCQYFSSVSVVLSMKKEKKGRKIFDGVATGLHVWVAAVKGRQT